MPVVERTDLLERSGELDALAALLADAAAGHGRLVLVHGEAGIGKTTLVRRFCDDAPAAKVLWGVSEPLFTPRPLAPLLDMGLAAEAIPYEVALALERRLTAHAPTIAVFEDMHLADEATLDVLRLIGRRVPELPAVVILTYRDDGLDRWHPLRVVLGELAARTRLQRVRPARLSQETVASLAAAHGLAGDDLYRKTAGNPFFVTEVLASGNEEIPETVRDVVLGRVSRLSPAARRLVDVVAVAGQHGELWLLQALAGEDIDAMEEATAAGAVATEAGSVAFRHELARLAVEEAIPANRRESLHRRALELLAEPPAGEPDPARLAHHAEAVGDGKLVLEFAPRAAAHAMSVGAHREAAAHYRRALRFAELAPPEVRAGLFVAFAQESYLLVDFADAAAAMREALKLLAKFGNQSAQGAAYSFLAQLLWQTGSLPEGLAAAREALALLEGTPGRELSDTYSVMALLTLSAEDPPAAAGWAERGQALAAQLDDPWCNAMALQMAGWVDYYREIPGGLEKLKASLDLGRQPSLEQVAPTACVLIARTACRLRQYDVAERYIQIGLEECAVRDFDVWRFYLISWQAMIALARGDWPEAARAAGICLSHRCPFSRLHALIALGLLRARRGDPDVWGPLDEALAISEPRHELQWIAQVAIARAEAAWLEGRFDDAIAETEITPDPSGTWWEMGLRYWRWRAGSDEAPSELGEEQFRLEMSGDWAAATESWRAADCRYEAAIAQLDAHDEATMRAALEELRALGAEPAVKVATARLRAMGARGVPRGPQRATRDNPAQLTARELEVLDLVAQGLRNAEIAERLFLAEKTVDHHVSAVLRKLDVSNRAQAAVEATRLGLGADKR